MGVLSDIGNFFFGWLKPDVPKPDTGVDVTKANTDASIPVCYGRVYDTGKLAFRASNDNDSDDVKNDLLHDIVIWSEGECGGVVKNYVNDERSNSSRFNVNNGKVYYAFSFANGMGTYSDPLLTQAGKRNTDTYDGKLVSYIRCEMYKDVFSGEPSHKAEFNGRLISTPSGGAKTVSENPVSQLYDYLKSPIYGKGLDTSFIDVTSFQAERAICDQQVETYSGSSEYRSLFTSNIKLETSETVLDNTNTLLKAMRGMLFHSDGKLKLLIEKDDSPVDFEIDENNQGFIEWGDVSNSSKSNRYNRVVCRYIEPDSGWTKQEVVYPIAGSQEETDFLTEDNGVVLEKSVALDTCIYYHEAAHHAKTMLLISREQLRTSVVWGPEAVILEVGDIVPVTRAALGWNGKLFRIESTEKSTYDGSVELKLREHQPYIYDDANVGDKPNYSDTDLTYTNPTTPSALVQTAAYDDFTQVLLEWASTTTDHRIVILNSDGDQVLNTTFAGKSFSIKNYPIGTYSASLYAIGGLGRLSLPLDFNVDVIIPPTPVGAPSVQINPGVIVLTPPETGNINNIYEGLWTTSAVLDPNTDSVSLFYTIPAGKSLTITSTTNQTYYIWYRLKTVEGNGVWVVKSVNGVLQSGTQGDSGDRGAGTYNATGSSWSDSTANAATTGSNVIGDRVTISNSSFSETRHWNGSSWISVDVVIDANWIFNSEVIIQSLGAGQITAEKLDLGDIKIDEDGVVVDAVSYDTKMFIDTTSTNDIGLLVKRGTTGSQPCIYAHSPRLAGEFVSLERTAFKATTSGYNATPYATAEFYNANAVGIGAKITPKLELVTHSPSTVFEIIAGNGINFTMGASDDFQKNGKNIYVQGDVLTIESSGGIGTHTISQDQQGMVGIVGGKSTNVTMSLGGFFHTNSTDSLVSYIGAAGVFDQGARVYSPNNPPPGGSETSSTSATPSTLAKRDGSGHINAVAFNSSLTSNNASPVHIMTKNGADNYLRPTSASSFRSTVTDPYYRSSSWTPTAAQVGALPDSTTANDIGALSTTGTAANSSKLSNLSPSSTNSGNTVVTRNSSGNTSVGTLYYVTLTQASTLKSKHVLERLYSTLDDVCKVGQKGVLVYTPKANPNIIKYGFALEETDPIFPHASARGDTNELVGMEYTQMISPLYTAMHELNEIIKTQQASIEALTERITTLENNT
ncbi:hypothetical protein [Paraglaciecola sp.]|uniref:hypothetical protein n=1 Tax=Paraglaciecola sp. TaxID=1920173 RepID=UPI003EF4DFF9